MARQFDASGGERRRNVHHLDRRGHELWLLADGGGALNGSGQEFRGRRDATFGVVQCAVRARDATRSLALWLRLSGGSDRRLPVLHVGDVARTALTSVVRLENHCCRRGRRDAVEAGGCMGLGLGSNC